MKKTTVSILFTILSIISFSSFAQKATEWVEPFEGNSISDRLSIVYDKQMILSQGSGILKAELNKDTLIHALKYKVDTIDISSNPFISLKLKFSEDMRIAVALEDDSARGTFSNFPLTLIKKDTIFNTFYFDISDFYTQFVGRDSQYVVNPKRVTAIHIAFFSQALESALVEIEELKAGSAVQMPPKLTGAFDNFSTDSVSNKWISEKTTPTNYSHILSQTNGSLKVDVMKSKWEGLWYYPNQGLLDISENPVVSVRAKATKDVTMRIFVWDNKNYYQWAFVDVKIVASDVYKTYYFNFEDKLTYSDENFSATVDTSKIKALLINFNPGSAYKGTVYFDEIKIGDQVAPFVNSAPTIDQIEDMVINKNSSYQTISFNGITSGDTLGYQNIMVTSYSNNTDVIKEVYVNYLSGDSGTITFIPEGNSTGNASITIVVKDDGGTRNGGIDSSLVTFNVSVVDSTTKILNASEVAGLSIYPSPVVDILNITSKRPIQKVVIQDLRGKEVWRIQERPITEVKADLSNLDQGIYFATIYSDNFIAQKKIVK